MRSTNPIRYVALVLSAVSILTACGSNQKVAPTATSTLSFPTPVPYPTVTAGDTEAIPSLDFDGRLYGLTLVVQDTKTHREVGKRHFVSGPPIRALIFSPDKTQIAFSVIVGGAVTIWN